MVRISTQYTGDLHCLALHTPSQTTLHTDAPVDNQGKGESFSPTDLLATALGTCLLTTMAISARKHGIDIAPAACTVDKEMTTTPPRRVAKLTVHITLPAHIPPDRRPALEAAAKACPVHHSLHPDVQTPTTFSYE